MQLGPHLHRNVELLAHLPFQTPTVILAAFRLATGKLPVSGQMRAREPFSDKDPVRALDNRGDHDRLVRLGWSGH